MRDQMRALYHISSGFRLVTPDRSGDGDVKLVYHAVAAFVPIYESEDSDDYTFVRPLGSDYPEQVIQRPDGMYITPAPNGMIGNERGTIDYFSRERRSGQKYWAWQLLDYDTAS